MTHTTSITVFHEGTEDEAAAFAHRIYEFAKGHAGFQKIGISTQRQFFVPGVNSNGQTNQTLPESCVRDSRG